MTKHACHLSFDDGLRGVYENVIPLLYKKGIPATLFINTGFVNNRALFFRHKAALLIDYWRKKKSSQATTKAIQQLLKTRYADRNWLDETASLLGIDFQEYLQKNKPYLTTEELKELQGKGFTIGAHSIDHPRYSQLDEPEQIRQTIESCLYVRKTFQEPKTYFSFPFSEEGIRDSFFQSIDPVVDLCFGISGMATRNEGKLVGRIDMERKRKPAQTIINQTILKQKLFQKFILYT